ncbi:MAG TPA: CPBP family intramembrane glutamic endopeptidase [Cyclobacteriaceae bacterium]|nr:CPBP family intramembrane glutamic endopeptidase [Cyclobacteriaceae bacterium]
MTERTQSLVSDREPVLSLFFILLVVLIGFLFIGPLVGLGISALFYEGNLLVDLQDPNASMFLPLMVMQGITSLIGLIIIPLLYIKFIEHKPITPFFPREKEITKVLTIIPILGICFLVAISPITEWNMHFQFPEFMKEFGDWARIQEDKLMEMTKVLTNFNAPAEFVIGLLVVAVLPGIGEELVFRGLIQNELWRGSKNIHVAIWVSAFLFSAIHIQFFGFVPRLLLGALFGYLYYWSGNLLIPMVAHFFHNGFTLTMIYMYNMGSTSFNIDSEESAPLLLVALCGVATFALLYYFRRNYISQPSSS